MPARSRSTETRPRHDSELVTGKNKSPHHKAPCKIRLTVRLQRIQPARRRCRYKYPRCMNQPKTVAGHPNFRCAQNKCDCPLGILRLSLKVSTLHLSELSQPNAAGLATFATELRSKNVNFRVRFDIANRGCPPTAQGTRLSPHYANPSR